MAIRRSRILVRVSNLPHANTAASDPASKAETRLQMQKTRRHIRADVSLCKVERVSCRRMTADTAFPRGRTRSFGFTDVLLVCLLAALVSLVWCVHYHRWTAESFDIPVNYIGGRYLDVVFTGDGLWGMSFAKLMAAGEISVSEKSPKSLGAPFGANWNDWPSFEEGLNVWWAAVVRLYGVFGGTNLTYLSGLIFAAATFYGVCRYLGYDPALSFAAGALFGLSRYAFWRNLSNLTLTFYWHLPLGLLVAAWCIREKPVLHNRRQLLVSGLVAILFGIQNPYYSGMFMQLLFWAAAFAVLRWRDLTRAIAPIGIGAVLILTTALMNLDTFRSWSHGGLNLDVATRSYFDVERYALKPVELFFPLSHSIRGLGYWMADNYFKPTLIPTEQGSAYIGIVAAACFLWLIFRVAKAITRRNAAEIPLHFWGFLLLAAFSATGGFNGVIGLFGFRLFRSSNRYSIVVMAILLLFGAKWLTRKTCRWHPLSRMSLALLILAVGLCDQVPPHSKTLAVERKQAWLEDEALVQNLEEELPVDAMVFQLPVHAFPEAYLTYKMDDYDQFRPYLHSSGLRFSYGDTRGRYQPRWQKEAEELGPQGMVHLLEKYGFGAVLINRDGYPDGGESLARAIRSLGKHFLATPSQHWIAISLNPARSPERPPVFEQGWYGQEGTYGNTRRWSSGNAVLALYNPSQSTRAVRLRFALMSESPRTCEIALSGETLFGAELQPSEPPRNLDIAIALRPGRNELQFVTDRAATMPVSGDPRPLAFAITNFQQSAQF